MLQILLNYYWNYKEKSNINWILKKTTSNNIMLVLDFEQCSPN